MMIHKGETKTDRSINYEVREECGVLSTYGDWETKLRYISWNGKPAKYDIRAWKIDDTGTEQCRKGITLSGEELEKLGEIIASMKEGSNENE